MPRNKSKQYAGAIRRALAPHAGKRDVEDACAKIEELKPDQHLLRWLAAGADFLSNSLVIAAALEKLPPDQREAAAQQWGHAPPMRHLADEWSSADRKLEELDEFGVDQGGRPTKREPSSVDAELIRDVDDLMRRRGLTVRSACEYLAYHSDCKYRHRGHWGRVDPEKANAEALRQQYRRASKLSRKVRS